MDLLRGQFVINGNEEAVIADEALRNIQYVGLYFSASWSPPCQTFLPSVKAVYEEAQRRDIKLEIIFVSSDHDNDEMLQFFCSNHGPWYALPVGSLAKSLRKKFHVVSIPTMIIYGKDGRVVTKNARRDIEKLEDPLATWFPEHDANKIKREVAKEIPKF